MNAKVYMIAVEKTRLCITLIVEIMHFEWELEVNEVYGKSKKS